MQVSDGLKIEENIKIENTNNTKNMETVPKHGPGLIGVASSTSPRYRAFDKCLIAARKPPSRDPMVAESGMGITFQDSINVAENFNRMCEDLMESPIYEWLWILGDDHVFHPDLLYKLLDRDVDIITPLCLRRHPPYTPTINGPVEEGHPVLGWEAIDGKCGLIEVHACGNAGMLIRRHVIAKIGGDWHRAGCHKSGLGGPDLWFCHRAREAGYKILIDTDNCIGHIEPQAIWPVINQDGNWHARISPVMDMPKYVETQCITSLRG